MRTLSLVVTSLVIAACAQAPRQPMAGVPPAGPLPADFSGSWERDYSRGDEVSGALADAYYRLARTFPDQQQFGRPAPAGPPERDVAALYALARLAELITRGDVLGISQDVREIQIEREDDFALTCAFHGGRAVGVENAFGRETCAWDGPDLVSRLDLADGLTIVHRFTVSADRSQLRVVTTLDSTTSRVPFTLRRFYRRFERPAPDFNCVETLSMKRVCSTGEIEL